MRCNPVMYFVLVKLQRYVCRRASRERERSADKDRGRKERDRERSPKPSKTVERVKRSRSRDTIKSSESKAPSTARERSRSADRSKAVVSTLSRPSTRYICDPAQFSLNMLVLCITAPTFSDFVR